MEINRDDFSFEESLKYLDLLSSQLKDETDIPESHSMRVDESLDNRVIKVYGTAMYIMVANKLQGTYYFKSKQYAYNGVTNLILKILQGSKLLMRLNMQADGGILALFDTPMKKDVEEIINLSGQVRSINEVAMRKFRLETTNQTVSVGIDYGPIYTFSSIFTGLPIRYARVLAECQEDNVNISDDIYINLPEELRTNLFANEGVLQSIKYHYAPLINMRMRKWVEEH